MEAFILIRMFIFTWMLTYSEAGNNTLKIGYLVPYTGTWPVGPSIASAIVNGIQEVCRFQIIIYIMFFFFLWNQGVSRIE